MRQYYERNGGNDIPAMLAYDEQLYPDQVEYYDKPFSRMDVLKDKAAYLRRWPRRSYSLGNDADIHCNQAISAYDFTGKVTWSASNPTKPATPVKSGVSLVQFGITVVAPSGAMRIVRESGKVVDRYPDRPQ